MSGIQPGRMIGPYQIISQVGQGGMATVYKAYQAAMDRYVAVKILPHQFMQDRVFLGRFQQEAHLIANLEHAHILPVYDYGESEGTPYLVMRLLDAGTLKDRIKANSQTSPGRSGFSLTDIDRIFTQLADALSYAHDRGVIHRDIKPSNVMLDNRGDVFLTDFGIAKLVEGAAEFTATGNITGTPAYMSPEQAQGEKTDQRTDIYALGVVLYEMLTGRVPYEADTPLAVIFMKLQEPLPLPSSINPNISPAIETVVCQALSSNPQTRFSSVQEFLLAWHEAYIVTSSKTQTRPLVRTIDPTQPGASPHKKPVTSSSDQKPTLLKQRGVQILIGMTILGIIGCIFFGTGGLLLGLLSGKSVTTQEVVKDNTPEKTLQPKVVLPYIDDFSDPTKNIWPRMRKADIITDFENEGYRIWLNQKDPMVIVNPGLQFSDAIIEVDANKIGGPDQNRFGVLCRYDKEKRTAYIFTLTSDGHYGIGTLSGGEQKLLSMDSLKLSYDIRHGNATNRISVSCAGDSLTLSINGQLQDQKLDREFQNGDLGLWVGTADQVGVDILFDNLSVTAPGSPENPNAYLLFMDDFSSTNGKWPTGEETYDAFLYNKGGFRITVNKQNIQMGEFFIQPALNHAMFYQNP